MGKRIVVKIKRKDLLKTSKYGIDWIGKEYLVCYQKKKFIKAMGYLNAYYIHFKLDIENEYVLAVWYEPFQTMDDTTFFKPCKILFKK